jgi:hypothetical protein
MPGFVASPDTLKILLHWSIHTRPELNVLHAHFPTVGPPDPSGVQRIFAAGVTALTSTGFSGALATTTSFVAVGMIDLRTEGVPEVRSTGTAAPGIGVEAALPDQVSLVITERTNKTGKSHRGRIYTLGMTTAQVGAGGLCQSAGADAALAWYQAIQAAMNTEGWRLAIRSPALPVRPSKPGGDLPAKPYEITEVTQMLVRDLIFDTNRRRTDLLRR